MDLRQGDASSMNRHMWGAERPQPALAGLQLKAIDRGSNLSPSLETSHQKGTRGWPLVGAHAPVHGSAPTLSISAASGSILQTEKVLYLTNAPGS